MTIWLASVVRGAMTSASTLFRLATLLVTGMCCAAAWREVSSMSVSTGYRARRRLLEAQVHVRTALSARAPPPEHAGTDPLGQTLAHLSAALGEHASFETFQHSTEVGLFG
jgi:hypothetical protein